MSELRRAVRALDPFRVHELLLAGGDPNERWGSATALHNCLLAMQWEEWGEVTLRVLLQHGADPNTPDQTGKLPIEASVHLSTLKVMLEAGATPNYSFGGKHQILLFARVGDNERVELLLEFGVDPNVRDAKGRSIDDLLSVKRPEGWRIAGQGPADDKAINELSQGLTISPEEYVAKNSNMIMWSYHVSAYENETLKEWAKKVANLLLSPKALRECYLEFLNGEELEKALKSNDKSIRRYEARLRRKELADRYVEMYGLPQPPFKFSHLAKRSSFNSDQV